MQFSSTFWICSVWRDTKSPPWWQIMIEMWQKQNSLVHLTQTHTHTHTDRTHLCQGHLTQRDLSGRISMSPRWSGPPAWGHLLSVAGVQKSYISRIFNCINFSNPPMMVSPYLNNAMSVLLTLTRVPLSSSLLFGSLFAGLLPNLVGLFPNFSSSDSFSFSFQSSSLSVSTFRWLDNVTIDDQLDQADQLDQVHLPPLGRKLDRHPSPWLVCPWKHQLYNCNDFSSQYNNLKHRKNCKCCPVSLLIVRSQRLSWIQVLNCQNCNQCLKGNKSPGFRLSLSQW